MAITAGLVAGGVAAYSIANVLSELMRAYLVEPGTLALQEKYAKKGWERSMKAYGLASGKEAQRQTQLLGMQKEISERQMLNEKQNMLLQGLMSRLAGSEQASAALAMAPMQAMAARPASASATQMQPPQLPPPRGVVDLLRGLLGGAQA